MKVAIMQPYFLPYIGYFQLMAAVDKFILFDDVNYIKGGWINRNRVICNGESAWVTIPLNGASPNKLISEIEIAPDNGWKRKILAQIRQNYRSTPSFANFFPRFESWIEGAHGQISPFLFHILQNVADMLNIGTEIVPSSSIFPKRGLCGVDRVIDICVQTGAAHYINAPGGKCIYEPELFQKMGIALTFIKPEFPNLRKDLIGTENLSLLHLMMHMPLDDLKKSVYLNE